MRYSDIMREATARVRDYIDDGYHVFFSNAAYSNMSFAILLTKDDVTGVAVSVRHWEHGLRLVESRIAYFAGLFTPSSWMDESNTISETFYYHIERYKWYATDRVEYEEAERRHRDRMARQSSGLVGQSFRKLEPTDRFFDERVRFHRGFKTAKRDDVEVVRRSWGYSVRKRGGGAYDYEVLFPRVAS